MLIPLKTWHYFFCKIQHELLVGSRLIALEHAFLMERIAKRDGEKYAYSLV